MYTNFRKEVSDRVANTYSGFTYNYKDSNFVELTEQLPAWLKIARKNHSVRNYILEIKAFSLFPPSGTKLEESYSNTLGSLVNCYVNS